MSHIDMKMEKKRLELVRKELDEYVNSNYDSVYTGMGASACPVCKFCGVLVSHYMKIKHLEFSHNDYYKKTIKPIEDKIQSISRDVLD